MELNIKIKYDPNGHDDHSGLVEALVEAAALALRVLAKTGVIGPGFDVAVEDAA